MLLKFVSCSRTAGLRVSTSEVLDCLNQLERVDPLDEMQFAAVLRANFAKSRREQAKFDPKPPRFLEGKNEKQPKWPMEPARLGSPPLVEGYSVPMA